MNLISRENFDVQAAVLERTTVYTQSLNSIYTVSTTVEVHVYNDLPALSIFDCPETAVRESKYRGSRHHFRSHQHNTDYALNDSEKNWIKYKTVAKQI